MLPLYAIFTWLFVVALDLSLAARPTSSTCTNMGQLHTAKKSQIDSAMQLSSNAGKKEIREEIAGRKILTVAYFAVRMDDPVGFFRSELVNRDLVL